MTNESNPDRSQGMTVAEVEDGLVRQCMSAYGLKNRVPTKREFNRWFHTLDGPFIPEEPDIPDSK